MARSFGKRYLKAFVSGFFVAVPVTVTFLDRVAYIARVEGASMQPSLNPPGRTTCDIVLLNRWSVRNYEVQRGDVISLVSPKNPEQKIIKRVIAVEGDIIRTMGYRNRFIKIPNGHLWIEGDHHGHSFDSNAFGPLFPSKKYMLKSLLQQREWRKFGCVIWRPCIWDQRNQTS
ncbi:mitochondrial inner membrane protease subunit 2 isoform X2 [Stegostoma tigrinum]|uniref:mitochondrial inner membrane protease subunit 2 isoform X2 n=1 Tax=Stegostoma tigrinum TaxID=3053191 RepID=UPI00202AD258|nr:mitochondrial inner membrane protease subunit 2 isoform X2 [Stegostoma tigrinum]